MAVNSIFYIILYHKTVIWNKFIYYSTQSIDEHAARYGTVPGCTTNLQVAKMNFHIT
jgi:hypothetical protein